MCSFSARESPRTFNPIKDRKNVCAGMENYGNLTVRQRDGSMKERPKVLTTEYGMRHNVWLTNTAGQDFTSKKYNHPAMFSLEFAVDHMKHGAILDSILDPFAGSGTTGVAAIKLGREAIMIEADKKYVTS